MDVMSGDVGGGFDFFFEPELGGVIEGGEEMLIGCFFTDGVDDEAAGGGEVSEGGEDGLPGGCCVDDGGGGCGGEIVGVAGPIGAERAGELAIGLGASEDIDG